MQAHHASTAATTTSPSQTGDIVLRTYDLTKHYGSRIAVNRLNLEVGRGEIVGFLGPNGAGKTTSIRMILSFGVEPLVPVSAPHALWVIGAYSLVFFLLALVPTWKRDVKE